MAESANGRALPLAAVVTLAILLLEHCTTVALTRFTQQRAGTPKPAPTVAVLLTELLKLVMSCVLEVTHLHGLGNRSNPAKMYRILVGAGFSDSLRLSVPAFLYTLQNNLIYVALGHIEMVTFQIMYQLKLLLTALLSVMFLGRKFHPIQWFSLVMLTTGVICVELSETSVAPAKPIEPVRIHRVRAAPSIPASLLQQAPASRDRRLAELFHRNGTSDAPRLQPKGAVEHRLADGPTRGRQLVQKVQQMGDDDLPARPQAGFHYTPRQEEERYPLPVEQGFGLGRATLGASSAFIAATFSSLAGVYFESVVKSNEANAPSLWLRNVQLCIFTIPIAAVGVVLQWRRLSMVGFFTGFDMYACALVTLNGAGGLLVAAVIKYGDNILKNFTTSCSVILGTVMSVLLFDFKPNVHFFVGATLVILSAYIFAVGPEKVNTLFGRKRGKEVLADVEEDESAPLQKVADGRAADSV